MMLGGVLATTGMAAGPSAGPEVWVTSSAINLRSQPSLAGAVLLVIPAGAHVGYQGEEQDGFTKVSYAGKIGWAKSDFLSPLNGGGSNAGGVTAAYRGQAKTSSSVNMRTGGGMNHGVKLVLPAGVVVEVYDDYANYFWLVKYNGQFGWVHADFLIMDYDAESDMPAYTGIGVTIATVNLRAGGGTNHQVLAVLPVNAQVELYEGPAGSWALVRHNGQFGYIHSDYIAGVL